MHYTTVKTKNRIMKGNISNYTFHGGIRGTGSEQIKMLLTVVNDNRKYVKLCDLNIAQLEP